MRIQASCEFIFDPQQKLYLIVDVKWHGSSIPLALSSLMTFLRQNEPEMVKTESDFCYHLAKFIKKVQLGPHFYLAIPDDFDMALFFRKAIENKIPLFWKQKNALTPLQIDEPLPLTVSVTSHPQSGLICTLQNREEWRENPLAWLTFQANGKTLCFSNGVLLQSLPPGFEEWISQFLDKPKLLYTGPEAVKFVHQVYTPYKKLLYWQIQADFAASLPQETAPVPILTVRYENGSLSSNLAYQYNSVVIGPDHKSSYAKDLKDGKFYKRMPELEAIYQEDLITLFTEYDLPFMLQSPGDIAQFLDTLVPLLKERGWIIHNHAPEFEVQKEHVQLSFTVQSSGTDWFYFEPSCEVSGQKMSLQEIARLMVQNKGYLKTKSGYVKVTDESQKELQTLSALGAFKVGQKFNKADLLPLVSVSSVQGGTPIAKALIDRATALHHDPCVPSKAFQGTLRDYQQYGLNWMHFLQQLGLGGVLADDMGLGKTIQAIAFSSQLEGSGPILVMGPTNVIYNWEHEIKKFLPDKQVLVYTGSERNALIKKLAKTDFIITSFGVLKNDQEVFQTLNFKAIFIDEAQYIKNPQAQISKAVKTLQGGFKLAMTGTPIENHLQDLWNLFDFVMPGYLGTQRAFDVAVKDGHQTSLKTKIKPFVLRREKREVLQSLPEKTEILIHCPMSAAQRAMYETVLEAVKRGIKNTQGKRERLHVLTSLLKLRQVCTHPGLIAELNTPDMESAKCDLAKEKIEELVDEGHKIVLFSQFTGVLDLLQDWAKKLGIYTERIDGSVTGKSRMSAVDRFQDSEKPGVFLISLKAGGVGINLTSAEYVLHLDPWWNPAVESQATDRVHRMGQKNKVIVYKFITQGTIEEKIQALQDSKRALLSQIIDIDALDEKRIEFKDLEALL